MGINIKDKRDKDDIDKVNNIPASSPEFRLLDDETNKDFEKENCGDDAFKKLNVFAGIHGCILFEESNEFVAHDDK